jgi:Fe-S oxidoreductase
MSSPHQPTLPFLFMRRMWFDDAVVQQTGAGRVEEVVQSIAETLAVSCPFCLTMMSDGLAASSDSHVQVRDILELLLEALG